jgi:hypothetical protein
MERYTARHGVPSTAPRPSRCTSAKQQTVAVPLGRNKFLVSIITLGNCDVAMTRTFALRSSLSCEKEKKMAVTNLAKECLASLKE